MKGRPPSRNKGLRDGYYIEVFNKGATTGIKIWKENAAEMEAAAEEYRKDNKTVIVHGEHRRGEWVNLLTPEEREKLERRSAMRKGNAVSSPSTKTPEGATASVKQPVKPIPADSTSPAGAIRTTQSVGAAKQKTKKPAQASKIKPKPVAKKAAKPAAKKVAKPVAKKPIKKAKHKPAATKTKKSAKPTAKRSVKKAAGKPAKPAAKKAVRRKQLRS